MVPPQFARASRRTPLQVQTSPQEKYGKHRYSCAVTGTPGIVSAQKRSRYAAPRLCSVIRSCTPSQLTGLSVPFPDPYCHSSSLVKTEYSTRFSKSKEKIFIPAHFPRFARCAGLFSRLPCAKINEKKSRNSRGGCIDLIFSWEGVLCQNLYAP